MWQFDIAHIPLSTFLEESVVNNLSLIIIKSFNLFRPLKKVEEFVSIPSIVSFFNKPGLIQTEGDDFIDLRTNIETDKKLRLLWLLIKNL